MRGHLLQIILKKKRNNVWYKLQRIAVNQQGLTLVELMAALALLVIIFTGFMTLATASSQMNIKAKNVRSQYEIQEKNIITDNSLEEKEATISLKVGSSIIPLNVTVKTAKGSEPLAIFE